MTNQPPPNWQPPQQLPVPGQPPQYQYPPQQYAPQQYPPGYGPPQPGHQAPKKKHTARNAILAVLGVLVIIIVIAAIVGGGSKKKNAATTSPATTTHTTTSAAAPPVAQSTAPSPSPATSAPTGAAADVTINGCELSSFGAPVAHLTVKNNSSKTSNYIITIAFNSVDGATQYDTGYAAVNNLTPGQSSQTDANSLKDVTQKFVCKLASVTRYAS